MIFLATTKIWAIYSDFGNTIVYATNEEKTVEMIFETSNQEGIEAVLNYTTRDSATKGKKYVTGINCNVETAYKEMQLTKEKYGKTGKILAHHAEQSFLPGEVTPDEAHRIGIELARRLWGDRHEVVVTTHLDKAHIHNHFVINSVSFVDGKKYYSNKASYRRMREVNDELCRMYGKSVVEEPAKKGIKTGVYRAEMRGAYKFRETVFEDIDKMIDSSKSIQEFYDKMKMAGYTLNTDRSYLRVFIHGHQTIRLDRKDKNYSLESIYRRINENSSKSAEVNPAPDYSEGFGNYEEVIKSDEFKKWAKGKVQLPKFRYKGYKALYIKFMYELGQIPVSKYKYNHVVIREEMMNAGKLNNEMKMLIRNNISTTADLNLYQKKLNDEYKSVFDERKTLRNQRRRATGQKAEDLDKQIQKYNETLAGIRKELFYCKDIKDRSDKLIDKLNTARESKEMGGKTYEHERS